MKYLPCDQMTVDIIDVQRSVYRETSVAVEISLSTITALVDSAERVEKSNAGVSDPVAYVLGLHGLFEPPELYTAYQRALKVILKRRRDFKNKMRQNAAHGRWAPFAPR